ncbi:7-cyano-7-deazaguanine synthase QueC [bacterium]|nr:7-cyano-7-deazaguanine synthase QueC [bacterium]
MNAIALLSGGLDSTVATWLAAQEMTVALALTCDYGQRAAAREIEAAARIAAALGAPHQVVPLPWLKTVAQDALTDASRPLPELKPEELDTKAAVQSAAAVWVPNRNGLLLNIAGVFAEALHCQAVIVGFNAEEGTTFPDNTPAFMHAAERAFSFSTQKGLQVVSPTVAMTKPEIVRAGRESGAPLDFVWSCYGAGPAPCRKCESCLRSQRAFAEAEG